MEEGAGGVQVRRGDRLPSGGLLRGEPPAAVGAEGGGVVPAGDGEPRGEARVGDAHALPLLEEEGGGVEVPVHAPRGVEAAEDLEEVGDDRHRPCRGEPRLAGDRGGEGRTAGGVGDGVHDPQPEAGHGLLGHLADGEEAAGGEGQRGAGVLEEAAPAVRVGGGTVGEDRHHHGAGAGPGLRGPLGEEGAAIEDGGEGVPAPEDPAREGLVDAGAAAGAELPAPQGAAAPGAGVETHPSPLTGRSERRRSAASAAARSMVRGRSSMVREVMPASTRTSLRRAS